MKNISEDSWFSLLTTEVIKTVNQCKIMLVISRLMDEVWIEIEKAGIPGLCK